MADLIDVEPGSAEWLAARRAGVTATDIVTIVGLSAWDSVYSLFWRKLGQVPDVEDNDRFRLGHALEEYILERWMEAADPEITINGIGISGLYRHSELAWQMATPDCRSSLETGDGEPIELKSWADADRKRWEDGPPAVIRTQVLWQMDAMDVS